MPISGDPLGRVAASRLRRDERREVVERGPGRRQHLGDALGGGPARAAFAGHPLGFIEGGGIEPGALGQPGRGKAVAARERVDCGPDPDMGESVHRLGLETA